MIINARGYQLYFDVRLPIMLHIRRTAMRHGICSRIQGTNDRHILIADFDNVSLNELVHDLESLMIEFELPDIYIVQSSPNHYHSYCFTNRCLRDVVYILYGMKYVDIDYIKLGVARGYYTLRYSRKDNDNDMKIVHMIKSPYNDVEISPNEVTLNEYYTTNL